MNSYRFRLFFDGLCAFVDRSDLVEAYALYGHGDHSGSLVIRSDFIDHAETTWHPTTIGTTYEPDGAGGWVARQVGVWRLHGDEVTFSDATAAGVPQWRNKDRLIDFSVEHPGSYTLTKSVIRKLESRVGIVNLVGGKSVLEPVGHTSNDRFALRKARALHTTRLCSRCVCWIPALHEVPAITNRAGDVITLRGALSSGVDAWASVSNVASTPHPAGLKHFHHFYEAVQLVDGDSHMTLENAYPPDWDCVPVVAWPPELK